MRQCWRISADLLEGMLVGCKDARAEAASVYSRRGREQARPCVVAARALAHYELYRRMIDSQLHALVFEML